MPLVIPVSAAVRRRRHRAGRTRRPRGRSRRRRQHVGARSAEAGRRNRTERLARSATTVAPVACRCSQGESTAPSAPGCTRQKVVLAEPVCDPVTPASSAVIAPRHRRPAVCERRTTGPLQGRHPGPPQWVSRRKDRDFFATYSLEVESVEKQLVVRRLRRQHPVAVDTAQTRSFSCTDQTPNPCIPCRLEGGRWSGGSRAPISPPTAWTR